MSWKTSSPVQLFSTSASLLDNCAAASGPGRGEGWLRRCWPAARLAGHSSAWTVLIDVCFHSSSEVHLICKRSAQQHEQGSPRSCDLGSGWHFLLPLQHPPGSTFHVIPSDSGQICAGKSRTVLPGNTHCTQPLYGGDLQSSL